MLKKEDYPGLVMLSQRVEWIKEYGEQRDCLDRMWEVFLNACGYLPVPVMNDAAVVPILIERIDPTAIILTGGNEMGNSASKERDAVEEKLLDKAIQNRIPVFTVCRGTQFLQRYFRGKLVLKEGHVRMTHQIEISGAWTKVNSFHNLCISEPAKGFRVLARSEDGIVEAMEHERYPIIGVMWHPERETTPQKRDIALFHKTVNRKEEGK